MYVLVLSYALTKVDHRLMSVCFLLCFFCCTVRQHLQGKVTIQTPPHIMYVRVHKFVTFPSSNNINITVYNPKNIRQDL